MAWQPTCDAGQELLLVCRALLAQELLLLGLQVSLPPLHLVEVRAVAVFKRPCSHSRVWSLPMLRVIMLPATSPNCKAVQYVCLSRL